MSLKTAAAKTGNGLGTFLINVVAESHNGPRKERIEAIDEAIETLNNERARLVAELIEN